MTFGSRENRFSECDYLFKTLMIIISITLFMVTNFIFCSNSDIDKKAKNEVKKIHRSKKISVNRIKEIWKFLELTKPELNLDKEELRFIEKNNLLFFEFIFLQTVANRFFTFLKKLNKNDNYEDLDKNDNYKYLDENVNERLGKINTLKDLYFKKGNVFNEADSSGLINENVKKKLLEFDIGKVLKTNFISRLFANNINSIFSHLLDSYNNLINSIYNFNRKLSKEGLIKSIYNDIIRYVYSRKGRSVIFVYLLKNKDLNNVRIKKDFLMENIKNDENNIGKFINKNLQDSKIINEVSILFSRKFSIIDTLIKK